jgi:predicted metalloprotease with PDZ domain
MNPLRLIVPALLLLQPAMAAPLTVDLDARELSRSLLRARLEIPAVPGELVLWYPKWIPGVHAPGGPVQNIAGMIFESETGEAIPWQRDDEEPFRFKLTVPKGVNRVIARLDYICNQPSVNSSGVDSFGNAFLGVINWNTVLLYPETASIDATEVAVKLRLPQGWRYGTALKTIGHEGEHVRFAPVSLRRLVDSPLLCGEHFREIDLSARDAPPVLMHLASESPAAIQIEDSLIERYKALVAEAMKLFGVAHFDSYHFLVVCSDQLPGNGLEHLASSFNSVGERDLIDEKKRKDWPAYLLPHEFVHSWCGKYRRPAGMLTANFHTPERTRLLWIYEGLTQYLGEMLTARSGLLTQEEYVPALAGKIDYLMRQSGRRWRSLEDTAVASWQRRARSPSWGQLRRGQDYYDEGLLVWLEADVTIRSRTDGKRSLDDFCRKFFARVDGAGDVAPFEVPEVFAALREQADLDWARFFEERIQKPRPELGLEFVEAMGYRLQYSAVQHEQAKARDERRKTASATASLGLTVTQEGRIASVIPRLPADLAGLAPGMMIAGVNGRKFTADRMREAIADSVTRRSVDLLILEGDAFREMKVPYADGLKYLELVRSNSSPDRLGEILKAAIDRAKGKGN